MNLKKKWVHRYRKIILRRGSPLACFNKDTIWTIMESCCSSKRHYLNLTNCNKKFVFHIKFYFIIYCIFYLELTMSEPVSDTVNENQPENIGDDHVFTVPNKEVSFCRAWAIIWECGKCWKNPVILICYCLKKVTLKA